jgi:hypothetical protein
VFYVRYFLQTSDANKEYDIGVLIAVVMLVFIFCVARHAVWLLQLVRFYKDHLVLGVHRGTSRQYQLLLIQKTSECNISYDILRWFYLIHGFLSKHVAF